MLPLRYMTLPKVTQSLALNYTDKLGPPRHVQQPKGPQPSPPLTPCWAAASQPWPCPSARKGTGACFLPSTVINGLRRGVAPRIPLPHSRWKRPTGKTGGHEGTRPSWSHYCSFLTAPSAPKQSEATLLCQTPPRRPVSAQAQFQAQASRLGCRGGSAGVSLLNAGTCGRLMLWVTAAFLMPKKSPEHPLP